MSNPIRTVGADAGATLCKLVLPAETELHAVKFPSGDMDALRACLDEWKPRRLVATGGGAARLVRELTGLEVHTVPEFAAWARGCALARRASRARAAGDVPAGRGRHRHLGAGARTGRREAGRRQRARRRHAARARQAPARGRLVRRDLRARRARRPAEGRPPGRRHLSRRRDRPAQGAERGELRQARLARARGPRARAGRHARREPRPDLREPGAELRRARRRLLRLDPAAQPRAAGDPDLGHAHAGRASYFPQHGAFCGALGAVAMVGA